MPAVMSKYDNACLVLSDSCSNVIENNGTAR